MNCIEQSKHYFDWKITDGVRICSKCGEFWFRTYKDRLEYCILSASPELAKSQLWQDNVTMYELIKANPVGVSNG